jgi:hypothetical protein
MLIGEGNMNIDILKKYMSYCCLLKVKPSWKGLSDWRKHNVRE